MWTCIKSLRICKTNNSRNWTCNLFQQLSLDKATIRCKKLLAFWLFNLFFLGAKCLWLVGCTPQDTLWDTHLTSPKTPVIWPRDIHIPSDIQALMDSHPSDNHNNHRLVSQQKNDTTCLSPSSGPKAKLSCLESGAEAQLMGLEKNHWNYGSFMLGLKCVILSFETPIRIGVSRMWPKYTNALRNQSFWEDGFPDPKYVFFLVRVVMLGACRWPKPFDVWKLMKYTI